MTSRSTTAVRVGIIGTGFIGDVHAQTIASMGGLAGVCGRDQVRRERFATKFEVPGFSSVGEMLRSVQPDYVVICTPHSSHMEIAELALEAGVHVLAEKPLCVRSAEARAAISLAKEKGMLFGTNFQMRLRPERQQMMEMISNGEIGTPIRVTLQATAWFRSQAYYKSSSWRGTWNGEGGGVLMNQAPHDLDMLVSAAGSPSRVFAEIGAFGHEIEVEDEAVALCKWPSGASGTLHLSTREAPGKNSLEIAGTLGTLCLNGDELIFQKLREDSQAFSDTTTGTMEQPLVVKRSEVRITAPADRYRLMHQNFSDAIIRGTPLICSAESALKQVQLSNALLVSALWRRWVELPAPDEDVDRAFHLLGEYSSIEAARTHLKH